MSVRWQLGLVLIVTVLLTLAGATLVAQWLSRGEIIQYVTESQRKTAAAIAPVLADFYRTYGSWEPLAQPLGLGKLAPLPLDQRPVIPPQARTVTPLRITLKPVIDQNRIVVTDAQGTVVADTMSEHIGQQLDAFEVVQGQPITVDNRVVGRVYVGLRASIESGRLEAIFDQRLQTTVWTTGLVVGLVTLLLAGGFATALVRPLHSMEQSAQRIAGGHFETRIQVKRNDELGRLADAFNRMAEQLQRAQRVRRQMVADIAHELRTPLSVIQGNLEAMADGVVPLTPERLSSMHAEALLLKRLVEDLRTLSLAEAGELSLNIERCEFKGWTEALAESLRPAFEEGKIRLEIDILEPLWLQADTARLRQVMLNLLTNALQHTPAGGTVRILAKRQGGLARIEVSDSGTGLTQEELDHLFDRFYRGRRSRLRKGSTGLGLAIVKALVEAQGGQIRASSKAQRGTTFSLTLPLA